MFSYRFAIFDISKCDIYCSSKIWINSFYKASKKRLILKFYCYVSIEIKTDKTFFFYFPLVISLLSTFHTTKNALLSSFDSTS